MSEIKIKPETLKAAAANIQTHLDEIVSEVALLKETITGLNENWSGEANVAFTDVFEKELCPVLENNVPDTLNCIIAELKTAADTMQETDENISQSFKNENK